MTPRVAQTERAALAQTARQLGPDASTLCGNWAVRDMIAHLILREKRPDAALGMFVPPLSSHTESVQGKIAQRNFDDIVDEFEVGPPKWSLFKPLDEVANVTEMFVHHEDILRANDPTARRVLSLALEAKLSTLLPKVGKLLLRRTPCTLVLATPPGKTVAEIERPGTARVTVTGSIGELMLWAFGRCEVDVELTGDPQAVKGVEDMPKGI